MSSAPMSDRAGSNQMAGPNSVSGMLSTLIPAFLVACVLVGLFLVLRVKVKRIYMPRTYVGSLSEHEKTPRVSDSTFGWIKQFKSISDEYILSHHSLDAFLFLRFWKLITLLCFIGWPITWIVLMPVYGTAHGGQKQFDLISFSNIDADEDGYRLYAVTFVAWILLGAIMYIIGRESLYAVRLQQTFIRLPGIASRLASRTVLFTNVPKDYLSEEKLRNFFPSVVRVWIARDTEELEDLVEERDKAASKLETSIVKVSKAAVQKKLKSEKKQGDQAQEDPLTWAEENKRPSHRLKFLIGEKVDTIDWARGRLRELVPQVEKGQVELLQGKATAVPAVFIEFENVPAAQAAFHRTDLGLIGGLKARAVGTRPEEIIWKNLKMPNSKRLGLTAVAIAIICVLIMFWGPIIAFIGSLSNIQALTNKVSFLSFINQIPGQILGVVTGLLPTILLAVAMVLVPIIMRVLFKFAGAVTVSEVELKTQTWYFVFQVIQVFLVTTLASGAAATATTIVSMPSMAPTLLAKNLPKASNFYINYFVLYGIAVASKQLFNIVAVLLFFVLGKFLDTTPRKMYNRYLKIAGIGWGSIYPKFTNLAVIAITYSCIAPLILAFATIGLFLLGIAFRYSIVYATDVTPINTQGRAYSKALQQLTTGVYLSCVCLIGLMGIATGSSTKALGALVLMVVFLVVIIIFHVMLNRAISTIQPDIAREHAGFDSLAKGKSPGVEVNSADDGSPPRAVGKKEKMATKGASMMEKILRPAKMPEFSEYLRTPIPDYTNEQAQEAYLNPAITTPLPLLWVPHDEIGVSAREKEAAGQIVGITDQGAWWDEKGKLRTVWMGQEDREERNMIREAPIWEDKVHY